MNYPKRCARCGALLESSEGYMIFYTGRCANCIKLESEEEVKEMETIGKRFVKYMLILVFLCLLAVIVGILLQPLA